MIIFTELVVFGRISPHRGAPSVSSILYVTLVTIENSISLFIMQNTPFHIHLTGQTCRHLRGALVILAAF